MYAQLRHLFGKRDFLIAREYQASLLFTIAQRYIVYLDSIFKMNPSAHLLRKVPIACKPFIRVPLVHINLHHPNMGCLS